MSSVPRFIHDQRLRSPAAVYAYLALASLIVAAASMAFASTPSYDPWAWLIWGREILHGQLSTVNGPSWKPLTVAITTVFALFGSVQPNLWVLIARWGAILAVLMIFKLALRLVWWLRDGDPHALDESRTPREAFAAAGWGERLAMLAPGLLAGFIAAAGMTFVGGYLADSALSYSEGLAMAFALIAIERAWDGHHRQAFVAGLPMALSRPESWLVWGPYGLWLMWRDPGARALVISLAVLTIAIWFIPQKLGGGTFTSGVTRAMQLDPNTPMEASFPFWAEFKERAWTSVLARSNVVAGVGLLISLTLLWRARHDLRSWLRSRHNLAILWIGAMALLGVGWWVVVCIETQAGFSGNDRYVRIGAAFVNVAAGATLGWGALALTNLARRRLQERRERAAAGPGSRTGRRPGLVAAPMAATAIVTVLFAFLPSGWVGRHVTSLAATRYSLHFQARLRRDLRTLIHRVGGPSEIVACGPVMVESLQVPMTAWYLNVRMDQVEIPPQTLNAAGQNPVPAGQWPATVIQTAAYPSGPRYPTQTTIDGWIAEGARYRIYRTPTTTLYQRCRL